MEAARDQGRGEGGARRLLAGMVTRRSLRGHVRSQRPAVYTHTFDARPSSWNGNLTLGNLLGGVPFLVFPLVGVVSIGIAVFCGHLIEW